MACNDNPKCGRPVPPDACCHPPYTPAPFMAPGPCNDHHGHCCPPPKPGPRPVCPPVVPTVPGTSQYIGARYVPVFADPIDWDNTRTYEGLTVVTYNGNSYISRCPVPAGTDINNTVYWVKAADYNAQVAQYRDEVANLSAQVTAAVDTVGQAADKVDGFTADIDQMQADVAQQNTEIAALKNADATINQTLDNQAANITALTNTVTANKAAADAAHTALEQADNQQRADIAQNRQNIQDNATTAANNAAEIAKHEARITDLENDVTAINAKDAAQDSAIASLRSDLTETNAKVAQLDDTVTQAAGTVQTYDSRLTAVEGHANTLDQQLDTLHDTVDGINTEVTRHDTAIAEHTTDIAALQAAGSETAGDIASAEADIAALKTRVGNAETTLANHSNELNRQTPGSVAQTAVQANNHANTALAEIGSLAELPTTDKDSVVGAIADISRPKHNIVWMLYNHVGRVPGNNHSLIEYSLVLPAPDAGQEYHVTVDTAPHNVLALPAEEGELVRFNTNVTLSSVQAVYSKTTCYLTVILNMTSSTLPSSPQQGYYVFYNGNITIA